MAKQRFNMKKVPKKFDKEVDRTMEKMESEYPLPVPKKEICSNCGHLKSFHKKNGCKKVSSAWESRDNNPEHDVLDEWDCSCKKFVSQKEAEEHLIHTGIPIEDCEECQNHSQGQPNAFASAKTQKHSASDTQTLRNKIIKGNLDVFGSNLKLMNFAGFHYVDVAFAVKKLKKEFEKYSIDEKQFKIDCEIIDKIFGEGFSK